MIPKKRTTFNSREASISLEEVLAFRNAIEQSKTYDAAGVEIPNSGGIEEHYDTTIEDTIAVLQEYGKYNFSLNKTGEAKNKMILITLFFFLLFFFPFFFTFRCR